MGNGDIHRGQASSTAIFFAMLVLACVLSPRAALAVDQPAGNSAKAFGPKIFAYAQSRLGSGAPANMCEVFAEDALTAAGDTIPKAPSASDAWSFFRASWQQYAPCAPQQWDQSKAQAGDLVFWAAGQSGSTCSQQYGHVAIYDGKGGVIENAGRGITNDKVNWPCTGNPTGFVPMTSCNGPQNNFTEANNATTQESTLSGQQAQASPAPQSAASSPQSSSSDMMSQMMPMMMMSMMMSQMMSMMNQSGSKGSSGSSGSSSGDLGGMLSQLLGSSGNNSGGSSGGGSSGGGSSGSSDGSATASGGSGSSASAGNSSSAQPSAVTSLVNQLVSSLQALFNAPVTSSAGASSQTASASPSGTGASGASLAMQQLQQLEDQQRLAELDDSGSVSPISAIAPQPEGPAAAAPVNPTQDWHQTANGQWSGDHRLSCGFRTGGAQTVAGCRSATTAP